MKLSFNEAKKKIAIVILAYSDYESLELALATHSKFSVPSGVDIYILQNGRGTYDCERAYSVAQRYCRLFPKAMHIVDYISPGVPYKSLKTLFNGESFDEYDFIIKLDDDVLVLTENWIEKLWECFADSMEQYGDDLAYVTSLVNNNPYGFKKIIEYNEELAKEYFAEVAREHLIGASRDDAYGAYRIVPANTVASGFCGTIWGYPHIARWLHEKTTFFPDKYIKFSESLHIEELNSRERYSINCMIFKKKFWDDIDNGGTDDERMCHAYCLKHNKKIIADLSIPMIHLFFYSQRTECRDMMADLRNIYVKWLNLPFSVSTCTNKEIEIENRLRFMESIPTMVEVPVDRINELPAFSKYIVNGLIYLNRHGFKATVKRTIELLLHL